MECLKVKELLSEYIEGVLDEQLKKSVEEHLQTCKSCSEELGLLKTYLAKIGSLEKIEAPKDFLEDLHERLQEESKFKKVIRKIFVPVTVKVPFEIAGAAAMLFFVIYLVKTMQPVEKMTAFVPSSREETTVDKLVEKEDERLRPAKTEQTVSPSEDIKENQVRLSLAMEKKRVAPPAIPQTKPIELVLLIKSDTQDIETYSGGIKPVESQITRVGLSEGVNKDMLQAQNLYEREISETDLKELGYKTLIPL
ncbi:MAG: zf-HC2 domain-containing protein, partial [Candidatus Ratteibacteria bacterium]|nr:zf-HC2 domain-containing protein [Candidatus Ratteibacteria bacterium]